MRAKEVAPTKGQDGGWCKSGAASGSRQVGSGQHSPGREWPGSALEPHGDCPHSHPGNSGL